MVKFNKFFGPIKSNKYLYVLNFLALFIGIYVLLILGDSIAKDYVYDDFHKDSDNIFKLSVTVLVNDEPLPISLVPAFDVEEFENQFGQVSSVAKFNILNTKSIFNNGQKSITIEKTIKANPGFLNVFSFDLNEGNKATALTDYNSVILTESLKKTLFLNADCFGQSITINGDTYIVTGVMKDIPTYSTIDFEAIFSYSRQDEYIEEWNYIFVALKENTNLDNFVYAMTNWLKEGVSEYYDDSVVDLKLSLTPLKSIHLSETEIYDLKKANLNLSYLRKVILTIFLLFIVFIYSINLILITQKRMKEYAVKIIYGATKRNLIIGLLTESFFYTLITGLLVLGLIYFEPAFNPTGQYTTILWSEQYFLFIVCLSVTLSIIPVIFPSILLIQINPQTTLIRRFQGIPKLQSLITMAVQVLVALLMLGIANGINRQIKFLTNKNLGFNDNSVLVLEKLNMEHINNKIHGFIISLKGLAGIYSITTVNSGSLPGVSLNIDKELAVLNNDKTKLYDMLEVGNNFINTLEIPLVKGRDLNFNNNNNNEVLVNESLVKQYQLEKPINQKLENSIIVGVVKDFNYTSLHKKIMPLVIRKNSNVNDIIIRFDKNVQVKSIVESIEKLSAKDFDGIVWDNFLLKDRINHSYSEEISLGSIMTFYLDLLAVLVIMGLFGVSLFEVNRKQGEMSIRMIYGANWNDLFIRLVKTPILLLIVSWIISIPLSQYILNQWLTNFEYRISQNNGFLIINGLVVTVVVVSIFIFSFYINALKSKDWVVINRNVR